VESLAPGRIPITGNNPESVQLPGGIIERMEIAVESGSTRSSSSLQYILNVQKTQMPDTGLAVRLTRLPSLKDSSFKAAVEDHVASTESDLQFMLMVVVARQGSHWPEQEHWAILDMMDKTSRTAFLGLAVHATSRPYKDVQVPSAPVLVAAHMARWSSQNFTHQVGFYGTDKAPMEIEVLT